MHESNLLNSRLKGYMHQVHMSIFIHPSVRKTECTCKSHCGKKKKEEAGEEKGRSDQKMFCLYTTVPTTLFPSY